LAQASSYRGASYRHWPACLLLSSAALLPAASLCVKDAKQEQSAGAALGMVDYSKWDKLDVSDDEEEDRKPKVHAFDAPQSVTIGGKNSDGAVRIRPLEGGEEHADPNEDVHEDDEPMEPADEDVDSMDPADDHREEVLECRGLAERALKRGDAAEAVRLLEKAMRMGGAQCPGLQDVLQSARQMLAGSAVRVQEKPSAGEAEEGAPRQVNGGVVGDRYCWSQTKEAVEVSVFVPEGTRAKSVQVDASETHMSIRVAGRELLAGEWEFKIAPEEDPDWEVRDIENNRRAVRLTVRKAVMPGGLSIVVWWKRLLKGEPEIDVTKIQGRKREASESFAKAWQEAHVQFREQTKNRKPIPVDVSGCEHESDGDNVHGGDGDAVPMDST